jgi:hypothetical protein
MKKLLRLLILSLFVLFSLQSYSQAKFGVKGGISLTNIVQNFDNSDDEYATVPRLLFMVGGVADIGFSDMISLRPELNISLKGFGVDVKEEYDADKGYDRYTIAYLDIPVNVALKFGGFQMYAGPYIAFAVWGKNKWDIDDDSGSEDIKFVMKDVELDEAGDLMNLWRWKRIDYGIGFGAGYKLGPVLLSAGAEIGLANLLPGIKDMSDFNPDDYKVHNLSISLTATFFLGK